MQRRRMWWVIGLIVAIGVLSLTLYLFVQTRDRDQPMVTPLSHLLPATRPLDAYRFAALRDRQPNVSQIVLDSLLNPREDRQSYLFLYETMGKRMSGALRIPDEATPSAGFPVVLLLRGFVDPSVYETGVGTRNAARVFADEGYVTISPDFLGYGSSDAPDIDSMADRVHKPAQVLDLIASLATLPFVDPDHLFMWAHSNGGQIALSVLEISGKPIPTTLWAPQSKPFPYSILYYTDEYDDGGKALRKVLADFETTYDVYDFSIDQYYSWIQAPLQLHQGTSDDAIPVAWSQSLVAELEELDKDITYYEYPGADHNMRPIWNTVILRDLAFFAEHTRE